MEQHRQLSIISKTTAVVIGKAGANTVKLHRVIFMVALTGTCVITGFVDSDGTAKTITFPAATPAGSYNFGGALNGAGDLTVICSNAAEDDDVAIVWEPV